MEIREGEKMKNIYTLLEDGLKRFPIFEYAFTKVSNIEFSPKVRTICEMNDCGRYGKCRNCPPLVGGIDECIERLRRYEDCLVISTVAEVRDSSNFEECLAARVDHEETTAELLRLVAENTDAQFALSSGCIYAESCGFPEQACRNPAAIPTIESHGIIIMKLAESLGMSSDMGGNFVTYFSLILFNSGKD